MQTTEIKAKLSALVVAMLAKGMVTPNANLRFSANERSYISLTWKDPVKAAQKGSGYTSEIKIFYGEDLVELFVEVDAFIDAQPAAEDLKKQQFLEVVAAAVDIGRQNGIELNYLAPLEQHLKKLSENILTHQAA